MMAEQRPYKRMFFGVCCLLLIIGVLFVYSSSSVYALDHHGSAHYYVARHLFGIVLGCIAALCLCIVPLSLIRWCIPIFFFVSLGLTALALVPHYAVYVHGSSRWLRLCGFVFQPSELLKVAFILHFALLLARSQSTITQWKTYLTFLVYIGFIDSILLAQPDFGLAITLSITAFLMLFLAGARIAHLVITMIAGVPLLGLLILYKPYRVRRIMTFLNPWTDPQGAGFQIIQSLIAIGSGGWYGIGIGNSKQKFFYLPMQHTDFIFSIIAEEIGCLGIIVLMGLFMLFLYSGLKLAYSLNNLFNHYVLIGYVLFIALQAFINSAVATGIAPTKGIGLPFISYGNTALVCTIAMLGLIANMVRSDNISYYRNGQ